jgi:hypothetical protein
MMDEQTLKDEIKLFKEHFSGQEGVLKSMRSLLIGLEVSEVEKERIKTVCSNKELRTAIRHRIYQIDTDDVPLGQMNDMWMGLDARLQGASIDAIVQAIKIRTKLIALFGKIESYLEDPFQAKVDLKVDANVLEHTMNFTESACDIMARNMYIKSVDMVLAIVSGIAGEKTETEAQALERIKKDSTK